MEYREINNCKISLLGFGCMRFPTLEDGVSIDEKKTEEMLDYAIQYGVNYLDTAVPYMSGKSEEFVGRYIKKYDRSKLYIATKLPIWDVKTLDDVKRIIDEQFKRLQVDYIDFYLIHAMNKERFETLANLNIFEYLTTLKQQGKIRNIGFSFHDEYEVFEKIIVNYEWDFAQIQYNYLDEDIQAGNKGYSIAEKLNVPLIIMEPLKGGTLANLPKHLEDMFKRINPYAPIASYSFRWLATHQNCKVILSGMSSLDQVKENIEIFNHLTPLNTYEKVTIKDIKHLMLKNFKIPCTKCQYCMPCPNGVNIPLNFFLYNLYNFNKDIKMFYKQYTILTTDRASSCVNCKLCETKCPQKIKIPELLKEIAEFYDSLEVK